MSIAQRQPAVAGNVLSDIHCWLHVVGVRSPEPVTVSGCGALDASTTGEM